MIDVGQDVLFTHARTQTKIADRWIITEEGRSEFFCLYLGRIMPDGTISLPTQKHVVSFLFVS